MQWGRLKEIIKNETLSSLLCYTSVRGQINLKLNNNYNDIDNDIDNDNDNNNDKKAQVTPSLVSLRGSIQILKSIPDRFIWQSSRMKNQQLATES